MAKTGRPKVGLLLSEDERAELQRLTRRAHVNRQVAFRARLVTTPRSPRTLALGMIENPHFWMIASIETVIGRVSQDAVQQLRQCSTPGGIETVIGSRETSQAFGVATCSTPGGIETVIGCGTPGYVRSHAFVLNARGHRDGDRLPWVLQGADWRN